MNKISRRFGNILFLSMILLIFFKSRLGEKFVSYLGTVLGNLINIIQQSALYNGLRDFASVKNNAWELFSSSFATLLAIVTLLFLFIRIRKQDKLLRETITSNASNRFRDAVKLLESDNDSVIIGAIYLMDKLARDQPSVYAKLVIDILCGYLKNETKKRCKDEEFFPAKFQTIIDCLFRRGKFLKDFVYTDLDYNVNLSGVNLSYANLHNGDFEHVNFENSNLNYVDFSNASLSVANLSQTSLIGTDFNNAFMIFAKLIDTDLSKSKNIDKIIKLDTINFGVEIPDYLKDILVDYKEKQLPQKVDNFAEKIRSIVLKIFHLVSFRKKPSA